MTILIGSEHPSSSRSISFSFKSQFMALLKPGHFSVEILVSCDNFSFAIEFRNYALILLNVLSVDADVTRLVNVNFNNFQNLFRNFCKLIAYDWFQQRHSFEHCSKWYCSFSSSDQLKSFWRHMCFKFHDLTLYQINWILYFLILTRHFSQISKNVSI